MKRYLSILLFILVTVVSVHGQRGRDRGSFSLGNLSSSTQEIPDSLLVTDSLSSKSLVAYQLTPHLGEAYVAPLDTQILNSSNQTLVEARSLAVGYTSNLGSPAQTRIFSERKEARDFIFADAYDYYITTPSNAKWYDTKVPYTEVMYNWAGGSQDKEEQFKGVLTTNFGKKVNIGGEMDYIYSRGHYMSNGNKLLSYRLFGSYRSDKYDLNAYLSNFNFINYENGGLADDEYFTNPNKMTANGQTYAPKEYPTLLNNTWNRVRGKQYYLTHRYNLGFYRTLDEVDEEGFEKEVFVPVSSIIHTFEYEDNRRRFTSNMDTIDRVYNEIIYGLDPSLNDVTSAWNIKNTFGLSLREGFQDWVKFGLTAFVRFEKRRFKLPNEVPGLEYGESGRGDNPQPTSLIYDFDRIYDEFTTYVGAELTKRQGSLLNFNARGELGIIGDDLGEFRLTGDLQSQFPLLGKKAIIRADGYLKNVTPAFYQRHFHSRYFWWDNPFKNVQQFYIGGEVELQSTGTRLMAGIESIQNYIYFDTDFKPKQHDNNIQVITARLKQDFKFRALGWENDVAYQLSSDQSILPLPEISAYSNLYVHFKLFKVLSMQIGTEVYYNTKYYAPYYQAATQQFSIQDKIKVGNYPLMNAYVNFHLKQARFYIMGYNISSKFADPNYFSLPHYPMNPMVLKMGVSVVFND